MADDGGRVLSTGELNRTILARQLLLERAADQPLAAVLRRMAFLQAQYAPSMYIGLWSRVAGFRRDDLRRALEDRTVVQGTLVRSTIHLVAAEDWWPATLAVRAHRQRWWLGAVKKRYPSALADVEAAAGRVREALARGPRKRADVMAELGVESTMWNGVQLWVDMVRVPPSGTWERRRADLYALAEDWIGAPPPEATEDSGLELLLTRYLAGFGPATVADAANWAGLPPAAFEPVVARLPLRRFASEDGKVLLDLPGGELVDADSPAPVRFLPTWDALLLAHARRGDILREQHRPLLFSVKTPQSVPSFLVDGRVAGTWRYERGSVEIEEFDAVPADVGRQLEAEAQGLAEFHR